LNSNVTLSSVHQKFDANHCFNLLTDARMLETVEAGLDAAIGACQGKGTGEYGLFRAPKACFVEDDVMLAYNLIRPLIAEAAWQDEVLPRQLSFKHTPQIWVAWSRRQFLSESGEDTATWFALIA